MNGDTLELPNRVPHLDDFTPAFQPDARLTRMIESLFAGGDIMGAQVCDGPTGRILLAEVSVADGERSGRRWFTAVIFERVGLALPAFTIHPHSRIASAILSLGGLRRVPLPDLAQFNATYDVVSFQPDSTRAIISSELIET